MGREPRIVCGVHVRDGVSCCVLILRILIRPMSALTLFADRFVTEVSTATIIITITGISGAIGQWAPFALVRTQFRMHSATCC